MAVIQPIDAIWRQEAHAAIQAGVAMRQIALTLPAGSKTRKRMLEDAEGWLLGAALRGVQSTITDELLEDLEEADRLADERLEVAA